MLSTGGLLALASGMKSDFIRTSQVFNWNEFVGPMVSLPGKIWPVIGPEKAFEVHTF